MADKRNGRNDETHTGIPAIYKWVHELTGIPEYKNTDEFLNSLRTGVVLGNLVGELFPDHKYEIIDDTDDMSSEARGNILKFIGACKALGIEEERIFEVDDLLLRENDELVFFTLSHLKRIAPQTREVEKSPEGKSENSQSSSSAQRSIDRKDERIPLGFQQLIIHPNEFTGMLIELEKRHNSKVYSQIRITKVGSQRVTLKLIEKNIFRRQRDLILQDVLRLRGKDHDNVAPVLGISVEGWGDQVAVISPHEDGYSLDEFIKGEQGSTLSYARKMHIALQMACGLHHLHSVGVYHRDVSLRNFLVKEENWNVKLRDFSLSNCVHNRDSYYTEKGILHPWRWCSYEVLLKKYHKKSDVFAFGVTLYELFSGGKVPFADIKTANEYASQIFNNQNSSAASLLDMRGIPNEIQFLIQECLNFKFSERPFMSLVGQYLKWIFQCVQRNRQEEKQLFLFLTQVNRVAGGSKSPEELMVHLFRKGQTFTYSGLMRSYTSLTNGGIHRFFAAGMHEIDKQVHEAILKQARLYSGAAALQLDKLYKISQSQERFVITLMNFNDPGDRTLLTFNADCTSELLKTRWYGLQFVALTKGFPHWKVTLRGSPSEMERLISEMTSRKLKIPRHICLHYADFTMPLGKDEEIPPLVAVSDKGEEMDGDKLIGEKQHLDYVEKKDYHSQSPKRHKPDGVKFETFNGVKFPVQQSDELFAYERKLADTIYGEVILAKCKTSGKRVVLKRSSKDHAINHRPLKKNAIVLEDIFAEIKLLQYVAQKSNSRFINKLESHYFDNGWIYTVLEHCNGGELFSFVSHAMGRWNKEKKLSWIKKHFLQFMTAIQDLHDIGVAHLDISLENILLHKTPQGETQLKVVDFGCGIQHPRFLDGHWEVKLKTSPGKANYMAPELINGEGGPFRANAADIWTCGIVLFMLAVGHPPFPNANLWDKRVEMVTRQRNLEGLLAIWDVTLPVDLVDLLQGMLLLEDQRLSIDEIINHPWFSSSDTKDEMKHEYE